MSEAILAQRPRGRLSHSFAHGSGQDVVARTRLLDLPIALVEDVGRPCACPDRGPLGFSPEFQVCLPYRGLFVWHVGRDEVVADANQMVFVTGGEGYRISSPFHEGYAELIVTPDLGVLSEVVRADHMHLHDHPRFRRRSGRAAPRVQAISARFLHGAPRADRDDLRAEEMVLALLRATLADDAPCPDRCGPARRRLVGRAKEVLAAEFASPLSLREIANAVGSSPAHLTDAFRRAEGVPLHRYRTQLRLAHALVVIPRSPDLTTLALDLGFSSHSHFSAAFRRSFGLTPSRFREQMGRGARRSHAQS